MMLLSSINISAVSVAFPDIISSFNTSLVLAGWVLSIYMLVSTASAVLIGKVSDIFGRKRIFLVCTALFIGGSLLSAIAPSIQLLIVFRFVQSLGGGGLVPVIVGIIADIFPHSRQKAIGFSIGVFSMGGVIGPSIGAWLISSWGWRSIFWFNIPLGILSCIPVIFLLKSDLGQKSRIDLPGVGYLVGALSALMIGLSQISQNNTLLLWFVAGLMIVAGVAMIVIFMRHEFKTREPIIELELLRRKPFAAANIYNSLYGLCVFYFSSFIPLYAVSVYKLTTIQSALILSAQAIGMISATTVSSFFMVRWGYRRPMLIGSIAMSICILIMGIQPRHFNMFGIDLSATMIIFILVLILGIVMGIAQPASSNVCIDLMPQRAATITGIRNMFRQGGGAISIVITTLLLQYVGDIAFGFKIIFISMGIIFLASIPCIYAMPDRVVTSIDVVSEGT